MASQATRTPANPVWAHAVPSWMTVSDAKSRLSSQKRAAAIEADGTVIPLALSCSSCTQKRRQCKALLGKKMRCARCTDDHLTCSLREPAAIQAIKQHFAVLEEAAQDDEAEGDVEVVEEEEDAREHEQDVEEEEKDLEDVEDPEEVDDEAQSAEEEEAEAEDDMKDDLDDLTDDEANLQPGERHYLHEANRRQEELVDFLLRQGLRQEAREERDRPIPPYQGD